MVHRSIYLFCTLLLLGLVALPQPSYATPTNTSSPGDQQCTNFADRINASQQDVPGAQKGILSDVYGFIKDVVGTATRTIFETFTGSPSYLRAINAAMILMVTFYAIGFMVGIVQPSFQQMLMRIVKVSFIYALISPGGWQFFSDNIVHFFQDGSDSLIIGIQQIATGIPPAPDATPFYALDGIAKFVMHPDTLIALMGAFTSGPYGLAMGGLMTIAFFGFFKLIIRTLEVYAITFVARSLILGLAPIFLGFLLFDRTKNIFTAWVNSLINLSLQPVLMFVFLSFFLTLINTSAQKMLGSELCWTSFQTVTGTSDLMSFWRFKDSTLNAPISGEMTFEGSLECLLNPSTATKCKAFPISIIDILSFLILVYLATRFADVVDKISSELSNAYVALDTTGKLEQIADEQNRNLGGGGGGKGGGGGANKPQGGQAGNKSANHKPARKPAAGLAGHRKNP